MAQHTVTVIPGDGVGPEVTEPALDALLTVADLYGHELTLHSRLAGLAAMAAEGAAISEPTMSLCGQSDAVLFGAVGSLPPGERRDATVLPEQALFRLRKDFQLFANLRPIRPFPGLHRASPVKPEHVAGTDLIFVRELSAGLYYGHLDSTPEKPSEIRSTEHGDVAIDTLRYTEQEIERVVRAAFDIAATRRGVLTSVDKANVLSSSILWRRVVDRVAAEHPEVTSEHMLVDACAMHLLRDPARFDVIVTENLFGDILTDESAVLTGSIGMIPSASLGVRRTASGTFGLYEPIHGAAPDIAGQDVANPVGAVLSAALLLRHSLGLAREAEAVEAAVEQVVAEGYRTVDVQEPGTKTVGTREMGKRIVAAIAEGHRR